ncbi:amidohydrolase family protein [Albibacterium indicum]|uniref:amidohydrolase family protein n=1 Tax=Albibacterium indicum TaxID=2292082 RepID=UPI000E52EDB1|nr:hypothetical protein [Pedobacter indicus]
MKLINRRAFVARSLAAAAVMSATSGIAKAESSISLLSGNPQAGPAPSIIDTNINLLNWPFRKFKYGETDALVKKLKKHHISQAWAGSFEGLFHKNIDAVNKRLAAECKKSGRGFLLPFGTVNIAWPDWKEDLRRCDEQYGMKGVKIFPIYQTFNFEQPEFVELLEEVAKRNMILQVVGDIDDLRNIHPIVKVRSVKFEAMVDAVKKVPNAKVELVYWNNRVGGKVLDRFVGETNVFFDISRIETNGGLGLLIEGKPWNGTTKPVPAKRIMFGSHAPFFPVETNLLKLFESPLEKQDFIDIANGNASSFLKTS